MYLTNLPIPAFLISLTGLLFINFVSWGFAASMVFLIRMLLTGLGTAVDLRRILAIIVHTNAMVLLELVAAFVASLLNWYTGAVVAFSLTSFISLDVLLRSVSVPDFASTLTIGISIATNFSKLKPGVLVTCVWLLGAGFKWR